MIDLDASAYSSEAELLDRFTTWRALETLDNSPSYEKGELYSRFYDTPAQTMQGVLLKLKLADAVGELDGSYLAKKALQDLQRLIGQ